MTICDKGKGGKQPEQPATDQAPTGMTWFVTFHKQKDGRINLGTAKHHTRSCPALKGHTAYTIAGRIVAQIPTCKKCYS